MPSESLTLDGLSLTSGGFVMTEVDMTPPSQRADWIGAADSEAQALFRQPLHNNRTVTLKLRVTPQASMDAALDRVGALVDKLRKASATTGGISLVWTPTDSARACTFTVLAGEITGLPIALSDEGYSWVLRQPIVTVTLTCQPYWTGVETLTSTNSSSTPINAFEIAGVTGDIPALGRLIVTDTATQSRRHVEWGIEGPLTYNNATSLLVDSDNMVVSGFSGAQAVTTGAYDPNASGNNSITMTPLAGATTAMAGTGDPLSHVGVFRVKARVQSGSLLNQFRLSWKAGDGPMNHNDWTLPISTANWQELDLGTITVPAVTLGTQRWTGQIEVLGEPTTPGTVALDYLILIPAADGYGKARAASSTGTGLLAAYDDFVSTTAGVALNARTAPLGGSWATSGDATDFTFADTLIYVDSRESAARATTAVETTGRFAILGASSFTDTQIDVRYSPMHSNGVFANQAGPEFAVIARYIDGSNYMAFVVSPRSSSLAPGTWSLVKVVAGVTTTIASGTSTTLSVGRSLIDFRLFVYATGHIIAAYGQYDPSFGFTAAETPWEAVDSALATGGTLASGKPGVRDRNLNATTNGRAFKGFTVTVPPSEPAVLFSGKSMQVRYDDTLRQDSSGTYYGRPPSYRGSRFLVPVGTSRVLVKARRNDIQTTIDDQVTDATQIQVGWTPRGLAVPR